MTRDGASPVAGRSLLTIVVLASILAAGSTGKLSAQSRAAGPQADEIVLRNRRFVTAHTSALPAPRPPGSGSTHLLLQFDAPVDRTRVDALLALGIEPVAFVPRQVVAALVPAGTRLDRIPGLRWAGPLDPADKISAHSLRADATAAATSQVVVFHPDVGDPVRREVVDISGATWRESTRAASDGAVVVATPRQLLALAADDRVAWIYPAPASREAFFCPVVASVAGLPVADYALVDEGWDGPGLGQAAIGFHFGAGAGLGGAEWTAVQRAMQEWARYVALQWTPHAAGDAQSVDVSWGPACHAAAGYAGIDPCFAPTTLAHAFYPGAPEPIAGDVHLNLQDFAWIVSGPSTPSGINVFDVALHELGHSLGLGHSTDPNAVMYPYLQSSVTTLQPDDIAGIQRLYRAGPYCDYLLGPTTVTISSRGGPASVSVTSPGSCGWTASTTTPWIHLRTTSGSGSATVAFDVDPNVALTGRSGNIVVGGQTVTVEQQAAPCLYTLSQSSFLLPAFATTPTIQLTTTPGCEWTVTSSSYWLVPFWNSRVGTGTAFVKFAVAPNLSRNMRTGTLLVGNVTVTVTQADTLDSDGDGMPNTWEIIFGLPVTTPDASDDPDGDGITNLPEYTAGTHPRGAFSIYFAEGATGPFFDTTLALANPGPQPAAVNIRFQPTGSAPISYPLTLGGSSRTTVPVNLLPGLAAVEFSTTIESDVPVVADRTMTWDGTGYGSHTERATQSPSTSWYLAEGATHSGFDLFYLLQNPGSTPADVEITFLLPPPAAPVARTYRLPPESRQTVWVNLLQGLSQTDVSAEVTSTNGVPIIVERAMYRSQPGQPYAAGHDSAGVAAPSPTWYFAEGATGPYFDTFLLLANPGTEAATVDVSYGGEGPGTLKTATYHLPPRSRTTVWVDLEVPSAATLPVAMEVRERDGKGIVAERAMWWPGPSPATWTEAHGSPGATTPGMTWAMGEGAVGGPGSFDTYICISNATDVGGVANVTLLLEDGTTVSKGVGIGAHARRTVGIRYEAEFQSVIQRAGSAGLRFGVLVENASIPSPGIVVERAVYSADGRTPTFAPYWPAGTVSLATKLQ